MTYMFSFYHWIFEINDTMAIFVCAAGVRVIRTAVRFYAIIDSNRTLMLKFLAIVRKVDIFKSCDMHITV